MFVWLKHWIGEAKSLDVERAKWVEGIKGKEDNHIKIIRVWM